jgi:hypothetical protein
MTSEPLAIPRGSPHLGSQLNDSPRLSLTPRASVTSGPIGALVSKLTDAFERGGDSNEVKELLQSYATNYDDWKNYCHYCPFKYARNLIAANDKFELMTICWKEGQITPIHNHEVRNFHSLTTISPHIMICVFVCVCVCLLYVFLVVPKR